MPPDEIGIPAPGMVPPDGQQIRFALFIDAIPPQFPGGVEVLMMTPGAVEVRGRQLIPEGAMLLYVPPENTHMLRAMKVAQEKVARAAAEKLARGVNDLGNRSR